MSESVCYMLSSSVRRGPRWPDAGGDCVSVCQSLCVIYRLRPSGEDRGPVLEVIVCPSLCVIYRLRPSGEDRGPVLEVIVCLCVRVCVLYTVSARQARTAARCWR